MDTQEVVFPITDHQAAKILMWIKGGSKRDEIPDIPEMPLEADGIKFSNTTRRGRRLIPDFIIPALDTQKYGEMLQWVDRTQKIFQIKWSHKNGAGWVFEDTNVFQDWDRLKGHYQPDKEGYYMQAKQRFRAALLKLNKYVKKLEYEEKGFKRYQLLDLEKKQPKIEKENKKHVRKIVRAIPTSVLCQNTSWNVASSSSSPSSYFPFSSPSSRPSQESNHISISSTGSSEFEKMEQSSAHQERQMRAFEVEAKERLQ